MTVAEKMDDNFLTMSTFTKLDGTTTYYYLPWVSGMQGLLYNQTQFEEAFAGTDVEVPRTTDELSEVCAALVDEGYTPFIYTSRENYWTCTMFLIWWAQYEGLENYSNFYQGIVVDEDGNRQMSRDVYRQKGRLRSLEVIESLIKYPTPNIHENVNTLTFTQAQARFPSGTGDHDAPTATGLKRRCAAPRTAARSRTNLPLCLRPSSVPSSSSWIRRSPTISSPTSSRSSTAARSPPRTWRPVAAITEDDFDKLYEARKLVLPVGNHNAYIPSYATGKELAKDFLLFMSTDVACNAFIEATNGASLPFEYDVETEDPELYESLAPLQKDRLTMQKDAVYMLNENTYAASYYGGITRFTDGRDQSRRAVLGTEPRRPDDGAGDLSGGDRPLDGRAVGERAHQHGASYLIRCLYCGHPEGNTNLRSRTRVCAAGKSDGRI